MARRKRVNQNKKKNGGTGTAVGNLLRKVTDPIKNATGRSTIPVQTASVNNFKIRTVPGDPSQVIPNGSIISRETQKQADKGKLSPMQMGNIYSSPAPRVNNATYDPLSTQQRINQNIAGGGNPLGPDIPQDISSRLEANIGDGGEVDSKGRSIESGVTIPSKTYNSYGAGSTATPTPKPAPTPTPEFSKGGVSNFKSTTPAVGGLSKALGQIGGGMRGEGIAGTDIKDDYYANLLNQLEKDGQDNPDLNDIRRKNEQRAQAEINSINAIYSDLVGRAQRTGEESMGSERAMQARSGTLASSFGQGALQTQAENTDKNVGEIENQRASTIADVYARSNENALNEFQTMKQLKAQDFETYQAVQAQEKSILENGLNDMAEYIALQGLSAEDLDMDGLKKIAKDWKSTPQKVYNSIMAKQAELQQRDFDQQEQRGEFDTTKASANGTVDNFGDFSDEAIAFSVLPTQLKNSDAEKKYYLEGIRQGLTEGLTPYEIADNLLGYKVSAPDQFSENIRPLIGESELAPQTIAQVAREINKGNKVKALELVENSIMARAKKETDNFVSESMTRTAFDRSSELISKIEQSGKSPIGVVKGSMENWLGKLRGKEASKIKADIVRQVAEMRKQFSGSAVTPSEERFLAPIVPDLSDKPDVFMAKLQALGSEPIRQLNNIRAQYGLVEVDGQSLKDKKLRVEDYYGMQSSAPQNTQTTSSNGGGGNWDW